MSKPIFTGAAVALVTPMNADGSVNFEKLDELIEEDVEEDDTGIGQPSEHFRDPVVNGGLVEKMGAVILAEQPVELHSKVFFVLWKSPLAELYCTVAHELPVAVVGVGRQAKLLQTVVCGVC